MPFVNPTTLTRTNPTHPKRSALKMTLATTRPLIILCICGFLGTVSVESVASSATEQAILERLAQLEANQRRLEAELERRDSRIQQLEQRLDTSSASDQFRTVTVEPTEEGAVTSVDEAGGRGSIASTAPVASVEKEDIGRFNPGGAGYTIAETPYGALNFGAWAYVRYLNQEALDKDYTDSFGREFELNRLNQVQVNKVNLTFTGWLYDPRFRYLLYTWTSNTSQGDGAQVVVAGNLKYRFSEALDVGIGIDGLPTSRSMYGTFPIFNKVDNRTMADEFFRGSYTTGIWASGQLAEGLSYKVMAGNNLSQLGVNAQALGDDFGTYSGRIQWLPTTGEFGQQNGYGDFDWHEDLATLVGLAATHSEEDRQSQPGVEDIYNSQIRLSDGTRIFQPDAFNTDGRIEDATYQMVALDSGMKYRGFSLEGVYFWRWVDDFQIQGEVPEDDLYDHGFEIQTSYMFLPRRLQGYIAGSKIFGEYGNPWDTAVGLNWFPFRESRLVRINTELLYLNDSPVGYSSVPYAVGGDGPVFSTNVEMKF